MVRPRIVEIGGGGLASLREQASGYDANGDGNPSSGVPERRPFLKRGEGRLGMTSLPTSTVKEVLHALGDKPAASRKAHPVKRSLSLERPASARRYVPTDTQRPWVCSHRYSPSCSQKGVHESSWDVPDPCLTCTCVLVSLSHLSSLAHASNAQCVVELGHRVD